MILIFKNAINLLKLGIDIIYIEKQKRGKLNGINILRLKKMLEH